jgi:hypothetical protein
MPQFHLVAFVDYVLGQWTSHYGLFVVCAAPFLAVAGELVRRSRVRVTVRRAAPTGPAAGAVDHAARGAHLRLVAGHPRPRA